jgi:hypothetical protein
MAKAPKAPSAPKAQKAPPKARWEDIEDGCEMLAP